MQIGPYMIERELGEGGMGKVYLGRSPHSGERVAVKVVHARLANQPEIAARFRAEGDALQRLSHPNLVGLRGRGTCPEGLWLAMDYVEGETLAQRLKRTGPLASPDAGELLIALCAGIAHAHAGGILHRDLKPGNVVIRRSDGAPLILDFGLALPLDVSRHLTQTGEILGSPGYLAPEQCGSKGATSPATDVYGLGAVLYTALTGQPPIQGSSLLATLDAVLNTAPKDPSMWVPAVDPGLAALCLRCLAKEPSERFASPLELARALQEEPPPPASGSSLGVAGAGVGLALGLALVGGGLFLAGAFDPESTPAATPAASLAVAPTPTRPSPAAPSPRVRTELSLVVSVESALSARDWKRAHAAFEGAGQTPTAIWLRYLVLSRELRASGQGRPQWRTLREAAVLSARDHAARAPEAERVWAEALVAMTESIRYPFASERFRPEQLAGLAGPLAKAWPLTNLEPVQRRELARSRALLEIRRLGQDASSGERGAQRCEDAILSWRNQGGTPWRVELAMGDVWSRRDNQNKLSRTFDRAESLLTPDQPWGKFAIYFVRDALTIPLGEPRTPQQLQILRTLLEAEATPRLLKAQAAIRLAESLVDTGDPLGALTCLKEHPAPTDDERLSANHKAALASAHLRAGQPELARDLFRKLEDPSPRSEALLAIAHFQLRDVGAGQSSLRGLSRRAKAWDDLIPLLEATALAQDEVGMGQAILALKARKSPVLDLRARDALERALAAKGSDQALLLRSPPAVLKRVADLRARALMNPEEFVKAHLRAGRWQRALAWIEEELGPEAKTPQPRLAARLTYRALERARDEVTLAHPSWAKAHGRALKVVHKGLSEAPLDLALKATLELVQIIPWERLPQLQELFARALASENRVPELYAAYLRVLSLRRLHEPRLTPEFAQLAIRAAKSWMLTFPGSEIEATQATSEFLPPGRQLPLLIELSQQTQNDRVRIKAGRQLVQAQVRLSRLDPALGAESLSALTLDPTVLSNQRIELLLDAADLWQANPGRAADALAALERLEAWSGQVPQELMARFAMVKSVVYLELDRKAEALAAGKRALAAAPEDPAQRGRVLAYLGRLEVTLGHVEAGRARLKEAVRIRPGPESWLEFARATEGPEQRRCYLRVLGYLAPPAAIQGLLAEVEREGHDVVALVPETFRLLEARGHAQGALQLAEALFQARADAGTARVLCEAFAVATQANPRSLRQLAGIRGRVELAKGQVPKNFRTLLEALLNLLEVRGRAEGPGGRRDQIAASLAAMDSAVANVSSKEASALRVHLARMTTYHHLAALSSPEQAERYRALARATLEDWAKVPEPDFRVASWLAQLQSEDGDYSQALATLEAGLRQGAGFPAQCGRMELERASVLTHLDRPGPARVALKRSLAAGGPLVEGPGALSHRAHILIRLGDLAEVGPCLAWARRRGAPPGTPDASAIEMAEASLAFEQGRVRAAGEIVARLRPGPMTSGQRARSRFLLFEARVARGQGNYAQAADFLGRGLEVTPRDGELRLERVELLVARGEGDAARAYAEQEAANESLSPRARRLLRARGLALATPRED